MTKVFALHPHPVLAPETEFISLLGQRIEIQHIHFNNDLSKCVEHLKTLDEHAAAFALIDMPQSITFQHQKQQLKVGTLISDLSLSTPVFDGQKLQSAMEKWGVRLADELEPGIWSQKHVLMLPGLNHDGLIDALRKYTANIHFGDSLIYFNIQHISKIEGAEMRPEVVRRTLSQLGQFASDRLFPAGMPARTPPSDSSTSIKQFDTAQILAGNVRIIRQHAPSKLRGKVIATTHVSSEDVEDLRQRGASVLITLLPNLSHDERQFARHHPAILEACLATITDQEHKTNGSKTDYLSTAAEIKWKPTIRYLQPDEAKTNRFAYITQPLTANNLRGLYRWTSYLPKQLLTRSAAYIPPVFLGRASNLTSRSSDLSAEAVLFMLGGTPEEFARRETSFVYRRLLRAARMAEQLDARLVGVSAYSDMLGEASEMVSRKTDVAITSGRSLTAAAALEAAQEAVMQMGNVNQLDQTRVVVLKATRPSVAACARYIAKHCPNITLISSRPEKLLKLKQEIERETAGAQVQIETEADDAVALADLIIAVTPISADSKERPFDITRCKPGTVICDLSRPPAVNKAESELRPDLLVVHASNFSPPEGAKVDYDFGLPNGMLLPSFVEATLLALEGRFEDFSLGQELDVTHLREIMGLAYKHGYQIAGIRSYDQILGPADLAEKRFLADQLRTEPAKLAAMREHGQKVLHTLEQPIRLQDVARNNGTVIVAGLGVFALLAGAIGWFISRKRPTDST